MRTNPILTVAAIAIASTSAAYYFWRDDTLPRHMEAAKSPISASLNVKNTQIDDERLNYAANPEQQRLARMNEKIAAFEARLRSMEATVSEQDHDHIVASPDEPEANEGSEKTKAKKLSANDFGHWLDETLDTGDFDREATRSTLEQMETSLAEVPGVNLADLQCGQRFCRASFDPENGEQPDIAQLIGASAFIESGFTIDEPDGRVKVYFTQPGQSLSELRSEAQESVFRNMHSQ
jgi:hypothetical protein